jgi:hypothetical protein
LLDLSHPKTPHVFAAARQLDLILEYLKKISSSDSRGRLFLIEVIRPCFVALRWLNTNHFGASPKIAANIDALEEEAERLSQLGEGRLVQIGPESPTRCPVCDKSLTIARQGCLQVLIGRPKERYCLNCLGPSLRAYSAVCSIDEGFITDAI